MVREEAPMLMQFIRHYLDLGASEIRLYCDGGLPAGLPAECAPDVTIVDSGPAFWAARPEGVRPRSVTEAQEAVYLDARAQSRADWMWIADADEYLITTAPAPDAIRVFLAGLPAGVDAVRIPTAEAVWGPGDDPREDFGCTYFRLPVRDRLAGPLSRLLYGDTAIFYRQGLLAHAAGKHFVRRTAAVTRIGNHDSYRDGKPLGRWAVTLSPAARPFHVAHFDAIGFDRWAEKWRRRYSGETEAPKMHEVRHAQKRMVQQAARDGEEAMHRLFLRLNTVSSWQVWILTAIGGLLRLRIFPAGTGRDDPPA